MANLALGTPTLFVSDNTVLVGSSLPAGETSLAGMTGFTFVNIPNAVIRLITGASGACNVQFLISQVAKLKGVAQPAAIAVANSKEVLFGPFDPTIYNAAPTGLVTATISVVTGNSVGVYLQPLATAGQVLTTSSLHNPFEMTAGAVDY